MRMYQQFFRVTSTNDEASQMPDGNLTIRQSEIDESDIEFVLEVKKRKKPRVRISEEVETILIVE